MLRLYLSCLCRPLFVPTSFAVQRVLMFVNVIGKIVHSAIHRYGGAANKNIGDAFLLVWSLPEADRDPRAVQQELNKRRFGKSIVSPRRPGSVGEGDSELDDTEEKQLQDDLEEEDLEQHHGVAHRGDFPSTTWVQRSSSEEHKVSDDPMALHKRRSGPRGSSRWSESSAASADSGTRTPEKGAGEEVKTPQIHVSCGPPCTCSAVRSLTATTALLCCRCSYCLRV